MIFFYTHTNTKKLLCCHIENCNLLIIFWRLNTQYLKSPVLLKLQDINAYPKTYSSITQWSAKVRSYWLVKTGC